MLPKALAQNITSYTLKIPEFEKAFRFALTYLDGLSVFEAVDMIEVLRLISQIDKRFKTGACKDIIKISNSEFNKNGTIFIGRPNAEKWRDEGDTGILFIMGGGV
jgi:hypothetical protein